MPTSPIVNTLICARQVATHAERVGIAVEAISPRPVGHHLGAILADAILQAGLNYRTVVGPRVVRIQNNYPDAVKLSGVNAIIREGMLGDFLLWRHPTKVTRFTHLADLLTVESVEDIDDFREWLKCSNARNRLLNLHGIGPKTYDYMCCLVGIDQIVVDRHIKAFAMEAGVSTYSYDDLQMIVSFAADLLSLPRREFDAWIWGYLSKETDTHRVNKVP